MYLSLTSIMLRCIGTSMNISTVVSVCQDVGIGHLMLCMAWTAFCHPVEYTITLIYLFSPIKHKYASHCPLDHLPSCTSNSAIVTPRDSYSNEDQCGTRYFSLILRLQGGVIFDNLVVRYPCSCWQYLDTFRWLYMSQPVQLLHCCIAWPVWQCCTQDL